MTDKSEKPKRPRTHEVGDAAVRSFNFHCPASWVVNHSQSDYGWDLFVTLAENYEVREEDFFVQLKGSDSVHYIENGSKVTFPLETGRISWLLARPMPSMLAVCDTSEHSRPVYWVWVGDAVNECLKLNPKALEQETLTLHIRVSNLLNAETAKTIEQGVIKFQTERRVLESMGQTIRSALGPGAQTEDIISYRDNPGSFLLKYAEPLILAGVLAQPDAGGDEKVEAVSVDDQSRFRHLKEIEVALQELRERDAEDALNKITQEIERDGSDYIKAFFYSLRGKLRQLANKLEESVSDFALARELQPFDIAHEAGLLHAEFAVAWCSQEFKSVLPKDWGIRAEKLLIERPKECRIIRLKAAFIFETNGPAEAEEFLRTSFSWELEPRQSICYLAYLHCHGGNLDSAQKLLAESQALGLEFDAIDSSSYGYILLRKAFNKLEPQKDVTIFGPGPPNMDFRSLRRARDFYASAYNYFRRRGFPRISGETVINYTTVLRLLGYVEQAVQTCIPYLEENPDDPHAHAAMAGCLMILDRAVDAVPHARAAFKLEPHASLPFDNLALCLYQAEEFEELLVFLSKRRKNGFLDKTEEELFRFLSVAAYTELGHYSEAKKLIEETKTLAEFRSLVPILEAVLAEKTSTDDEKVINIFRQARNDYPRDPRILTHFVSVLFPITNRTAPDLISCLEELRNLRQLASYEYRFLSHAYICMDRPEDADKILSEGASFFPDDSGLAAEMVNVQVELGNEEKGYELLSQITKRGIPEYSIMSNLGTLAARTGRLDKAIEFFEKSLAKAKDDKEKGLIHNQLHQLRLRRGDDPVIIRRHVVNFGKTVTTEEEEVRYLMMFLISPEIKEPSDETVLWTKDFKKRLAEFTKEHPDFPGFMSFKIPEDLPDEDKGFWIASELAAVLMPHALATAKLWQSAREKQWPLVFRASYCPGESIFDYWSRCTASGTFADAIHIFGSGNDLGQEIQCATKCDIVCMDVTALITMAALDLLDLAAENFRLVFIAESTRYTILMESSIPLHEHDLAVKIRAWMEKNRARIRIRRGYFLPEKSGEIEPYHQSVGGIWIQQKDSALDIAFPYGVGDTLLLAKKLGAPLYSDESTLRSWAVKDYGLETFSTVAFAGALVRKGFWTNDKETDILATLIKMNHRWVPFGVTHLNRRLKAIVTTCQNLGVPITSASILQDDSMLYLIRWFGESKFPAEKRLAFAISWWRTIIAAYADWREILAACLIYPMQCYIASSVSSVLRAKILRNEREEKAAHVLSAFLWVAYKNHEKNFADIWLAIKDCVRELFPRAEDVQKMVLLILIPKWLYFWANQDSIDVNRMIAFLVDISSRLPYGDKEPFETALMKVIAKNHSRL